MPQTLPAGRSKVIVWAENTLTLTGSAFDSGGATIFYFNPSTGSIQSFKAGRTLNSLTSLTQWRGYLVQAGTTNLTLPDSVLGFDNALSSFGSAPGSPPSITTGQSSLFVWGASDLTLTGSLFDDGASGTTIFYFDASDGSLKSFKAGRASFLNALTTLVRWRGYLIQAGSNLTLPNSTAGFGYQPPVSSGTVPQGTIALTSPLAGSTLISSSGEIPLTGNYNLTGGSLTAIEAQFNNSTWSPIATNPTGGSFRGVLPAQPANGQLRVRFAGNNAITSAQTITLANSGSAELNLLVKLPNVPITRVFDVKTAITEAAKSGFSSTDLLDSMALLRNWWQAEPTSSDADYDQRVSTVSSWGASVDPLTQSSEIFKPLLTTEGWEFSINPQSYLAYDGSFLANNNFAIFIVERREALNAGWFLGGSSSAASTNLEIGYASPTSMVFRRVGGDSLTFTVPATLSADFRRWAFVFDGTKRSIWLNGAKVAEVTDNVPLNSFPNSALGFNYSATYIGKIRTLAISTSTIATTKIPQIDAVLREYLIVNPSTPGLAPLGSISLVAPVANATYAVDETGVAKIYAQGTFFLEDESGALPGIEAKLPGSNSFQTIISRPPGPDFLVELRSAVASGDFVIGMLGNPETRITVSGLSVIDARVQNLTITASGKSVTVSWSAPAGGTVTQYTVGISRDNGANWTDVTITNPATTTYTFSNLIGGTYLGRVRATLTTSAGLFLTTTDSAYIEPTPLATIASNLVSASTALLRFDDTANQALDTKGFANFAVAGTLANIAGISAGSTNAIVFPNNTTNYISDPTTNRFRLGTACTIIFVFRYTGTYTSTFKDNTIIARWEEVSGGRSYLIAIRSGTGGDQLLIRHSPDGTANYAGSTPSVNTTTANRNRPVLGMVRWNSTERVFRLKLVAVDKSFSSQAWTLVSASGLQSFNSVATTLGICNIATGAKFQAQGNLDYLAFLNREIDDEEGDYLDNSGLFRQV